MYEVIGAPPVLPDVHVTTALALPAVAETQRGPGAVKLCRVEEPEVEVPDHPLTA